MTPTQTRNLAVTRSWGLADEPPESVAGKQILPGGFVIARSEVHHRAETQHASEMACLESDGCQDRDQRARPFPLLAAN